VEAEEGARQVHPRGGRCQRLLLKAPWDGAGIQAGTWRPWHTALPSRVLRPQQGSMPPVCLSKRARPAQPEGGREAMVAGSCPALPRGLGSWKGYWEEPWAPSHHSPGSWLWRERLTPRGQPGQPGTWPTPELPWVSVWARVRACVVWFLEAGTLSSKQSSCSPGILEGRRG
jgi:hypothetical protein